jgi:hypothetical protein
MRFYPTISQTTKFQKITTHSYYDSFVDDTVFIPFIYENNTLDINIQDNVQADLIDVGSSPGQNTNPQCKTFGGLDLVLRLGPKMLEWLTQTSSTREWSITNQRTFRRQSLLNMPI